VIVMQFSPDGGELAVGHESGLVTLWNVRTRRAVRTVSAGATGGQNDGVTTLAFNTRGTVLAVSAETGSKLFATAAGGGPGRPLRTTDTIFSLAFTPDDRTLVAGDVEGNVELFDASTLARAGTLAGGGNDIFEVAVSADGQTIAAGDSSGVLWLWDRASEQQLGLPIALGQAITGAQFVADGRLVTAGASGAITVWPALLSSQRLGSFESDLCPRLAAELTPLQWSLYVPGQPYHATCRA
jgi:WD40 repeat protein